jgi:group II intron reverse transcriptase/maturase/CRISPR-associated protein Cas4
MPSPEASLMEKLCASETLLAAWRRVRRNKGAPGVDRVTVERFDQNLERRLVRLQRDLRSGRYRPLPLRRVAISKPAGGTRLLGIPTVRDRIAQTACLFVLEPIIEEELEEDTYAYRRGRSIHHAIYRVKELRDQGYRWVVDADIDAYFDHVDHAMLMETVGHYVRDTQVLALIKRWVEIGVLENFRLSDLRAGIPQGAPISPLLANLYLDLFDEIMADAGYKLVRYADDFVVLCRSAAQAEKARQDVGALLEEFRLRLDSEKTQVVHFDQGFKYLGAIFVGSLVTMPQAKPKISLVRGAPAVRMRPAGPAGFAQPKTHTPPSRSGPDAPMRQPEAETPAGLEGPTSEPGVPAGVRVLPGLVSLGEVLREAHQQALDEDERARLDPLILLIESRLAARRDVDSPGGRQMERIFEGPRLLPISSLGEYVYCPRLFFYRQVWHLKERSQAMLAGKVLHAEVDQARVETTESVTRLWSVEVVAPRLGVTGRIDLVEQAGDLLYPVEYKKGAGPAIPPGVRVQLCAEAMALEEVFGIAIPHGFVHFFETDRRERVTFSAQVRHQTMDAIGAARAIVERLWVPEARYAERKCGPCSLRAVCLPWETMRLRNLLRRRGGEGDVHALPDGTGLSAP